MSKNIYTVSKIKAILACSGFENDPRGSVALEKGSIIHDIFENGLKNYDKKGSTYRGNFRPYTHKHNIQEYEDIAEVFMSEHPEFFTEEWEKEQEINCTTTNGFEISGIVDIMKVSGTSAVLCDYKTGVSRAKLSNELDMLQAIWYSFIVFKTKPSITSVKWSFLYVEGDEDFYLTVNFDVGHMARLESIIEKYIFASKFTGMKVQNRCAWCKKKATCPLLGKEAETLEGKGVKKVKANKKACESFVKDVRDTRLEEGKAKSEDQIEGFTTIKSFYLGTHQLTEKERLKLVKERIKLTKKQAIYYKDLGFFVEEKISHRMK